MIAIPGGLVDVMPGVDGSKPGLDGIARDLAVMFVDEGAKEGP